MNFGRTCKRFLALGRPRRARFAASPTAHLPHPRFLAAREDEQNGDGLELGALPGAQFAGNVCHNHLSLRSHYHTTASRDNVLVYTVAGAVAVVAGGFAMDQVEKLMEQRKKQADVPHSSAGRNFYKGAFEPEMTKREAALILGVRESASKERVKEAHRKVLMLNHPDTGGSTYVATKINEAKDMLLREAESTSRSENESDWTFASPLSPFSHAK